MNQSTAFPWGTAVVGLIWVLGAAVILADFGLVEYMKSIQKKELAKPLLKRSHKYWILSALILLLGGFYLIPTQNGKRGITKRSLAFLNMRSNSPIQGDIMQFADCLDVPLVKIEKEKPYEDSNTLLVMLWNSYIGTPFIRFEKGAYEVEIKAWGSKAGQEFSKIIIYFAQFKRKKLKLEKLFGDIELDETKKSYIFPFDFVAETVGKIRVQFYNDGGDAQGGDRNVWIERVTIRRVARQ